MMEEEFIKSFVKQHKNDLEKIGLTFSLGHQMLNNRYYPDLLVLDNDENIISIIEVKKSFNGRSIELVQDRMIDCFQSIETIKFGVIINFEENCLVVVPRGVNSATLIPAKFVDIMKYLFDLFKKKKEINEAEEKEKVIKDLWSKFNGIKGNYFTSFLRALVPNDIVLSAKGNHLTEEKEKEFFSRLLWSGFAWVNKLTKYGSKSALFRLINDKKQSMASIVNMNDKSECDFADNLLKLGVGRWYDPKNSEETTNCFIMSMVSGDRKDELTPWRLYGDNAKGASITYNMGEEENRIKDDFFVAPICYVNPKKGNAKINAISNVMKNTKRKVANFTFVYWYIWKHFFKPDDYAVEKEYRIIYQRKPNEDKVTPLKWVNDSNTNIIFPVVEFFIRKEDFDEAEKKGNNKLSLFPFPIEEIVVGPNMREQETNEAELNLMIQDKLKLINKISASTIANYRG